MSEQELSPLEYHVLLATAAGPQYGYAVKQAVEVESEGVLRPGPGTLYRVIARLIGRALLVETDPPTQDPHPGQARRWYQLTGPGALALRAETARQRRVAALAAERLGALDEELS